MKIICSPLTKNHSNGLLHPESPERINRLLGLFKGDYSPYIVIPDVMDDIDCGVLAQLHEHDYALNIWNNAKGLTQSPDEKHLTIDNDTSMSNGSFDAIKMSLQMTLHATKLIKTGAETACFCATRPPGHHAEYDKAMGFCFYNWVYIAAAILTHEDEETCKIPNGKKALIIDFDVHHGNGTDDMVRKACTANQKNIGFISLHEHPNYPGTGLDVPEKQYPENILNIPYPPHTDSQAFFELWDGQVLSFIERFKPDYLILSAGFDAHIDDPLSEALLQEDDFERMVTSLSPYNLPVLSFLEGGYNLDALENCVTAHLDGLINM